MAFQVDVPAEYGYVILGLVLCGITLSYLGTNVTRARKTYNVPYPALYAESSHPNAVMFNCYQRAHQNALETVTEFFAFALVGGLQYPNLVAVGLLLWCVGRIVYAHGYYSGKPQRRVYGEFFYVSHLINLIAAVSFALHLLRWL